MSYHTIGINYEETKDLDIKEIAKLVRRDIKQAYPTFKTSVRIERYSMGQSLNVTIQNTDTIRRSEAANAIEKAIKNIVDAYNFDDSDSASDYFHVRFYSHIKVED